MISFRKADLIDKIKENERNNSPVGKNFILVPYPWRSDTKKWIITAVSTNMVEYRRDKGMPQTLIVGEFLGCRDDKAFFVNDTLDSENLIGLNLYVGRGSADKGIIKTDTGQEFKAEEHDFIQSTMTSVTSEHPPLHHHDKRHK